MGEPDAFAARLSEVRGAFSAANARLIERLRAAPDEAAERSADGGWSAARIGWHVAAVTTRFAGLISGAIPGPAPAGPDYRDRTWAEIAASIPDRLEAPAALAPPPDVRRADAVAALEASGAQLLSALEGLTAERGEGLQVVHPIAGAMRLYQVGEWAAAHVIRHNRQAKRALGQG